MTQKVKFTVPNYVRITQEAFDGASVTVEYDSSFGGTQTVTGKADLVKSPFPSTPSVLVVGDRKIQANGYVLSGNDGRRLGTVESVSVELDHNTAVDVVTKGQSSDVDRGPGETIVQTWDDAVIESDGFMAGTDSVNMEHVN